MPYNDVKAAALLSTTAVSDLSSETQTTLYTVPVGYKLILTEAWLETAGDVGANLVVTIGRSTALTDFVGSTTCSNLDADEDVVILKPVPSATPATNKTYAAGVIIQIDVATAGNAVAGVVYLFGFLVAV
jgi:hypothetical protein